MLTIWPSRSDLAGGYIERMEVNPYESPREARQQADPKEQVNAGRYSPFLELFMVIVVLAVVIALLFPAIQ